MQNNDIARRNLIKTIIPIIIVSFVSRIAGNIYIPALPDITQDLLLSNAQASSTITIYFMVLSFSCLLAGIVSDYTSKSKILIWSCIVLIVGSILCAIANNVGLLLIGRGLQALGGAFILVTSQSWLGEISSKKSMVKIFAYFSLALGIAPLFAPTMGGIITETLSWRYNFYLIIALSLLVIYYFLKRSLIANSQTENKKINLGIALKGYAHLISSPLFIPVIGSSLLCYFFQGGFMAFSSFLFIEEFGMSPATFGIASIPIITGLIVGRFPTIYIEKKYGVLKAYIFNSIFIFAPMACSLLYYLIFGKHSVLELLIVLTIFNIGFSGHVILSLRNAMIIFKDKKGQVSASINFLNNTFSYLAALLVQILFYYNVSFINNYNIFAIIVICVILMLYLNFKHISKNIN